MLDPCIVSFVKALLTDRKQFFLHHLLHPDEAQLGESLILFGETEPHVGVELVSGVKNVNLTLYVVEEHVEINSDAVIGVLTVNVGTLVL